MNAIRPIVSRNISSVNLVAEINAFEREGYQFLTMYEFGKPLEGDKLFKVLFREPAKVAPVSQYVSPNRVNHCHYGESSRGLVHPGFDYGY